MMSTGEEQDVVGVLVVVISECEASFTTGPALVGRHVARFPTHQVVGIGDQPVVDVHDELAAHSDWLVARILQHDTVAMRARGMRENDAMSVPMPQVLGR